MIASANFGRVLSTLLGIDAALIHEVALVADQHENQSLVDVSLKLGYPSLYVVERAVLSQIENQQSRISVAIVHRCHRSESLLACRVPYLRKLKKKINSTINSKKKITIFC